MWDICKQECLLWSRRNTCITKSERKFEDQMDIHVFIYESKQNVIDSEKRIFFNFLTKLFKKYRHVDMSMSCSSVGVAVYSCSGLSEFSSELYENNVMTERSMNWLK